MKYHTYVITTGILLSGLLIVAASQLPGRVAPPRHMPGDYTIPDRFQQVTFASPRSADDLLPAARNCLDGWAGVRSGGRLRLVTDDSIPSMVEEAFRRASGERGIEVQVENHSTSGREGDPSAGGEFDATLYLAYRPDRRGEFRPTTERSVRVVAVPELLASDWARMPLPLLSEIADDTQSLVARGRRATLTDPAGTRLDFAYTADPADPEVIRNELLSQFPPRYQVSLRVSPPDRSRGWIVTHSRWTGFFPLGRFQVEAGLLSRVLGGGVLGERLKTALVHPQGFVGLKELTLGTSPLALRYSRGYTGSPAQWGHLSGTQRAGVATFHFQKHLTGENASVEEHGVQVYFPTLKVENETLIEEGFLKSLEAPSVVRVAASLGVTGMLVPQCGAESLPRLPDHVNPTITPVTSAEVLAPGLQALLADWIKLGSEERVILLSDETVPAVLVGAMLERLGGTKDFELIDLTVPDAPVDAAARLEAYNSLNLPEDVWTRMAEADVAVALTYMPYERLTRNGVSFREWLPTVKTRFIAAAGLPEIYAGPWGRYPIPLLHQLARHTVSRARLLKDVTLTTGEGGRLSFEFQAVRSIPKIVPEPGFFEYHLAPGNYYFSLVPARPESVEGLLITRRVEGMATPRIDLTLENGRIVKVDGEGTAADWIRARAGAEGGLRLARLGTHVHPKTFPWEQAPYPGWTPSYWANAGGNYRAGIVQVEFEGSSTLAIQLQLASVQIGTRELISQGRFLILEDPNLRATAVNEGYDPEIWLKVDWIPQIGRPQ